MAMNGFLQFLLILIGIIIFIPLLLFSSAASSAFCLAEGISTGITSLSDHGYYIGSLIDGMSS